MKIAELWNWRYALEKWFWIFKQRMCFRWNEKWCWLADSWWQSSEYNTTCIWTLEDCEWHFIFSYVKPKRIQKLEQLNWELKQELELLQESQVLRQKIIDYKKSKK